MAALASTGAAPTGTAGAPTGAQACDRTCLNGYLDRYLKALSARDPQQLPWARNARFTENAAPLKPGDGLWGTLTGLGTYKLYVDDPQAGQAGMLTVVDENGRPALMSLRLKIANGQIVEAETKIARTGEGQRLVTETLKTAPASFAEALSPTDRPSRAELIRIADSYFDAIEHSDGNLVPFAADGFRIENGVRTCNNPNPVPRPDRDVVWQKLSAMPCRQGFSSHVFSYIKSIEPRRYDVVDVEHGVVFADPVFNHPGTILTIDAPGLGKFDMTQSDWASHPTGALITEVFKIKNRQIVEVAAV
ncbi:MAG TPA: hypothetical protein VGC34_18100, partial [Steroidobacteraceae bacterium]